VLMGGKTVPWGELAEGQQGGRTTGQFPKVPGNTLKIESPGGDLKGAMTRTLQGVGKTVEKKGDGKLANFKGSNVVSIRWEAFGGCERDARSAVLRG